MNCVNYKDRLKHASRSAAHIMLTSKKRNATAFMELIRKWNLGEIAECFISKGNMVQAQRLWGKSLVHACVCVCVIVGSFSSCYLSSLLLRLCLASIRLIIFLVNCFFTPQSCHVSDRQSVRRIVSFKIWCVTPAPMHRCVAWVTVHTEQQTNLKQQLICWWDL